ncbi:MAG: hypothetical protein JWM37_794 [Candidatus Saccharibacteria bacterium]|nr:hypothetical protein [Candidatus Saccharibacteria bacterium]
MSRLLAELLAAPELAFRARLHQLEQASGAPGIDVRLTAHLIQANQHKLKSLGLDAHDTTGPELYAALNERYLRDDRLLSQQLAEGNQSDIMANVRTAISELPLPERALAIKSSAVKKILKKVPPKATMKLLGYRSLESLLKHEPVAALQAVAEQVESATWQKSYRKALAGLQAIDFETRPLAIVYLEHDRWQKVAVSPAIHKRHHLLANPVAASLILLPYGSEKPAGATLTTLVLAVTAINRLAAASSYLKVHQMRADFGEAVLDLQAVQTTPLLTLLSEPISWHLIQRYYHRFKDYYRPELFEPYLQPEDFRWLAAESVLAHLAPQVDFWRGSSQLAQFKDGGSVSYNLHDVALNACNHLSYEQRVSQHFKDSLWHELLLHYLRPVHVEEAIASRMQPAFAEA